MPYPLIGELIGQHFCLINKYTLLIDSEVQQDELRPNQVENSAFSVILLKLIVGSTKNYIILLFQTVFKLRL